MCFKTIQNWARGIRKVLTAKARIMFSVEVVMSMWEFVNLFALLFCVFENLHNRK